MNLTKIAEKLFPIQPLSGPNSLIFYLREKYVKKKEKDMPGPTNGYDSEAAYYNNGDQNPSFKEVIAKKPRKKVKKKPAQRSLAEHSFGVDWESMPATTSNSWVTAYASLPTTATSSDWGVGFTTSSFAPGYNETSTQGSGKPYVPVGPKVDPEEQKRKDELARAIAADFLI